MKKRAFRITKKSYMTIKRYYSINRNLSMFYKYFNDFAMEPDWSDNDHLHMEKKGHARSK